MLRNLKIDVDAEYGIYNNFNYEENFYGINDDFLYYIDYGNISSDFTNNELFTIKSTNSKYDLLKAYDYLIGNLYIDNSNTKEEIIEELYNADFTDLFYPSWSRNESINDILDITMKFEVIVSRGYSQGDITNIIIPHNIIKTWSITKKEFLKECNGSLEEILSHYIWDSPIVGDFSFSFEYTENCVNYVVVIDCLELYEVLNNEYELNISSKSVINIINAQMIRPLDADEKKLIEHELSKFDYTDIKYPCVC